MKMQQFIVLTLAVVFFTACGQKKESAQQEAVAQPTSTPAPTVTPEQAKLDAEKAAAEKAAADKKAKEGRGSVGKNRAGKKQAGAGKSAGSGKKHQSSTGSTSDISDSIVSTQELQLTGGKSKSGLVYTGSNADFIITQLAVEEKMKPAAEQNKNAVLAASVWEMSYLVDSSGQLHIDIEFTKGNGLSKVQVKAPYKAGGLMEVEANVGSASAVSVTAECIDTSLQTNQCSNLLVTFMRDGAEVTALLRQTLANIWFEYEKVEQANEYATLVEFFKNAKLDVETANKVDKAFLNTFEVVNGKSGFKAVITGKKNQVMGFEADLLIKKDLGPANIAVVKQTQFKDIDMWMGRLPGKDVSFMQAISGAKLVDNNTKGQITIDMTVSSASTGTKNAFTLKFIRIPVSAEL